MQPSSNDYLELLFVTDSIMRDIFDSFFKGVSDALYGYTKVDECKALTPFLVQCTVMLFFAEEGFLPSSEQLTEVAVQELKKGKSFHQEYLARLHGLQTQAFAAATDVIYISTQKELDAALLAEQAIIADNNAREVSPFVSSYALPLVVVGALLLLVGFSFIYWRHQSKTKNEHTLDPNENIMKHKDRDIEEATTAGETYRTSAFSEDGATITSDPATHTISIKGASATLKAVTAETLNQVFIEGLEKASPAFKGQEKFAAGDPLGTFSFTVQTQ